MLIKINLTKPKKKMTIEQRKEIALNDYRAKYNDLCALEVSSFIIGMKAMEKIIQDIEKEEFELNSFETMSDE